MAETPSKMIELGAPAADFQLPDTTGSIVRLTDFAASDALLVMFICNHCPYVKHISAGLAQFAQDYQPRGTAVVAINANDPERYPQDGPAPTRQEIARAGYTFPYLFDADQSVAQAYGAACTPDFFLYDRDRKLAYRGQFDASRPGNLQPVTGADLRAAADAVLAGEPVPEPQIASVGCNIKWSPGNEPTGGSLR
jgi:peroxiredoxin